MSSPFRWFARTKNSFVAAAQQESKVQPSFSGTDLVRNIYRSIAESIDDMFFGLT